MKSSKESYNIPIIYKLPCILSKKLDKDILYFVVLKNASLSTVWQHLGSTEYVIEINV